MGGAGKILISILNWNGLDDTLACLANVMPGDGDPWDVLVIDNGSREDPGAALRAAFPQVHYERLAHNHGFTGGQNHGMQRAIDGGYEAVLLLNSDCELGREGIRALFEELRADPAVAGVSPLIYCAENRSKPQMVGAWFDWPAHQSRRPSLPAVPVPEGMTEMLPGTALLLRCSALREIGLLDPAYFAYYEDNDLCARIARHGMRVRYCQRAQAWHASRPPHQYSDMAIYLSARNTWRFWRAHTPAAHRRGLARHLLAQSLYEIAVLKKAGATGKCRAVVAGLWDAQRGRQGPPPASPRAPAVLSWAMCVAPYLLYELVSDPRAALKARLGGRRA